MVSKTLSIPSGLLCLEYIAKKFDKSVEVGYLQYRLGEPVTELNGIHLCRCANWIGLKAKGVFSTVEQLGTTPLPAIVEMPGGYYVLNSISSKGLVLYCPRMGNTKIYTTSQFSQLWGGTIYLLADGGLRSSDVSFGFNWFLPSIVKHYSQAKKIIYLSFFIQLIALATPIIFENVVDRVLVSRSVSSLHVLGIALFTMAFFEPLFGYMRSWLYSNLASKFNAELSAKLYSHLVSLPLSYFDSRQTGQITARVREIEQIRQFLSGSALTMILDLVFIGIFIAVLFAYAPLLTWVVIGSLVLYFIFWVVIGPSLRSKVNNEYEETANNTAFLTESITGIETVKTNTLEVGFEKQWENRLASQLKAAFKARIISIWAQQGITVIQKLTSALTLWWGVQLVMVGDLSSGELVAFNMLAGQVTQPILRLAQVWQDYQHTLISLRRVGDILDEPQEAGSQGMASIPEIQGEVAFNRVRFRYDVDSPEVLKNLSLTIKAGEFVGITGRSGSGKSTLTKLLQRLYTPTSGQILIDGLDLAIADPVELRRNMSVVLQDSRLFSGTIAENIRQCVPSATDEEVVNASKLAGAHDFVTTLPAGYATPVGENGSRLSGGQKQRIALARALITNPRILILDEATSALDYESEAKIIERLPEIVKGRTVISIAHRLNSLTGCDRVINLNDGHLSV
ncbi:type I secretion system permease/ATPase [Aeromonas sp. MR16]|uniref:type I secretion system permease/ATPase n=1 Tax=Aeromonas sp. MR16 TaxID=2923420 RepID=UPI001F4BC036|nr:type I secretion system permease/ATPase [Aeromonas sp. MR16]MCH7371014.1 type I secretion system permease/ATPase [Aeromonas sp. MR16]